MGEVKLTPMDAADPISVRPTGPDRSRVTMQLPRPPTGSAPGAFDPWGKRKQSAVN